MAKDAREGNNKPFDQELVQSLVNRIDNVFGEIETERGKFMKICRELREDISNIYEEAQARGVPKKELRKFVTARMKLDAARKILDDLEEDQRETVELLAEAFGDAKDLPLFASRIERAQPASA